jgi:hypothetical protein
MSSPSYLPGDQVRLWAGGGSVRKGQGVPKHWDGLVVTVIEVQGDRFRVRESGDLQSRRARWVVDGDISALVYRPRPLDEPPEPRPDDAYFPGLGYPGVHFDADNVDLYDEEDSYVPEPPRCPRCGRAGHRLAQRGSWGCPLGHRWAVRT